MQLGRTKLATGKQEINAMKYEMHAHFPAPSEVVMKMFTDKQFHSRKLEKMGVEFKVLEHTSDGDKFYICVQRMVPMNATGIAAKFMPATTQVTQGEEWFVKDKRGSVDIDTKGAPIKISCTAKMQDQGEECVVIYDWDVKAKIPIGGGALEKFVIADMKKREAVEREAATSLLDEFR